MGDYLCVVCYVARFQVDVVFHGGNARGSFLQAIGLVSTEVNHIWHVNESEYIIFILQKLFHYLKIIHE